MVDDVSVCSVRAHLKWLVELGHCSSLLLQVYPPLKLSVLVDQVSMCSVRAHLKWLLKFTPQVTSITFKFTARVTFKFIARVTFKFTARVTFKFTARVTFKFTTSVTFKITARVTFKFTPPFETVTDDRSSIGRYMSSVRAHSKLLKFTAQVTPQVYCSSYSSTLPVCFTTPCQLSADIWNTITLKKFHI